MVRKWLILISWPTTRRSYYDAPVNRICKNTFAAAGGKTPGKMGFMIDCAPVRVHRLKDN